MQRRKVIQAGAAVMLAHAVARPAIAQKQANAPLDTSYIPIGRSLITGKGVGDFDFLTGEWTIRHLRLKDGTENEWQRFDSGASVHRVLGGMGSIEELRKADGSFMGMGVRLWLPQQKKWADHWTSAGNGVINPAQLGEFIDGEGLFISNETIDGVKWLYRGVWDRITPNGCRWHQSSSKDGGKSWQWNWWMEWTRVA